MKQKLSFKIAAIVLVLIMVFTTVLVGLSGLSETSDPVIPITSSKTEESSVPTVQKATLIIETPGGEELVNSEITVSNASALEATKTYLTSQDIPFEQSEATLTSINGIASSETEGWVLYVDGVLSQVNPSTLIVKNDATLLWKREALPESTEQSKEVSSEEASDILSESDN